MTLVIDQGDYLGVDRSGFCSVGLTPDGTGIEQMEIRCSGATIRFEDEREAVLMAKQILWRMGETYDGRGDRPQWTPSGSANP